MKQTTKGFVRIGIAMAMGMLLASCGGGGANITVTGDLVELAVGDLDVEFILVTEAEMISGQEALVSP